MLGNVHNWEYYEACRMAVGTGTHPDALRIGEGPHAKVIRYTYRTDGTPIFHLAEGPHQTICASTIMPLYILRYTPATGKLENLGRGGP